MMPASSRTPVSMTDFEVGRPHDVIEGPLTRSNRCQLAAQTGGTV
jgi:hypothetical protein